MESQTKTSVQHVALDSVEGRVDRLRGLRERLTDHFLELAVALHEEHVAELWTRARTREGALYENEEDFWEEAVGVKRRTAYQLIAVGEVLARLDDQAEASKALSRVGLYRLDILVPVLKKEPTIAMALQWADLAKAHSREALREMVGKALGRPERVAGEPGDRFRAYVTNAMPDGAARQLAEDFFAAGAQHSGTHNAVAIMIAGFQDRRLLNDPRTPRRT